MMSRKWLIAQAVAGLILILLGCLMFWIVSPTAKSMFDLRIDSIVGILFLGVGMLCLGEAIAKALGIKTILKAYQHQSTGVGSDCCGSPDRRLSFRRAS
jgi:hypothetical protein